MSQRTTMLAVAGALAVLAAGMATAPGDASRAPAALRASAAPVQVDGRTIFTGKGNCTACHGRDARGTPLGPDLTDGQWLQISGSLDEIREVIRRGVGAPKSYPAPMPPLGGARLREAELEAVARYIFSLGPATAR